MIAPVGGPSPILGLAGITEAVLSGDLAELAVRVVEAGLYYLDLGRQSFCWGIGARDFYTNGWRVRRRILGAKERERVDRIQTLAGKTWKEALHWAEGRISRGVLLMGSGFFGTVDALHRMGWLHAGPSAEAFAHTASIMFFSAHILSIYYCAKELSSLKKLLQNSDLDEETRQMASRSYRSAMFGLLSSAGYLFASAVTLCGASLGLTLALAALASITGCLETIIEICQKGMECQMVSKAFNYGANLISSYSPGATSSPQCP